MCHLKKTLFLFIIIKKHFNYKTKQATPIFPSLSLYFKNFLTRKTLHNTICFLLNLSLFLYLTPILTNSPLFYLTHILGSNFLMAKPKNTIIIGKNTE